LAAIMVDRRRLDRGDLMLPEVFAHDIKPACQRGIAEGPLALAGER
jgi:hypothetical protein